MIYSAVGTGEVRENLSEQSLRAWRLILEGDEK